MTAHLKHATICNMQRMIFTTSMLAIWWKGNISLSHISIWTPPFIREY